MVYSEVWRYLHFQEILLRSSRKSHTQYSLYRHRMATVIPILKKVTGALPLSITKGDRMHIIFALKPRFKAEKLNALRLPGIASGFGDFVNPTRVHHFPLLHTVEYQTASLHDNIDTHRYF